MITRNILDANNNIIGTLGLPDESSEQEWTDKLLLYTNTIPPVLSMTEIVTGKIQDAAKFGSALILQFSVENVLMGITQAGKTRTVSDYCAKLQAYLTTGSLYAAIDEINSLVGAEVPSELAPFITEARLNNYKLKLVNFLGL